MDSIKKYKKSIFIKSFVLSALVYILLVVNQENTKSISFSFGYLISVLNFQLLSLDIAKITLLNGKKFYSGLIIKFFLRYGILALSFICAIRYNMDVALFVIGLFVVQIVLFVDNVLGKKRST